MERIGSSPFVWLVFGKDGALQPRGLEPVKAALSADGVSDLVVISHGWKNDKDAAKALYGELWPNVERSLRRLDPQRIVVAGVQWPSRRYTPAVDQAALERAARTGGGALSAPDGAAGRDFTDDEFRDRLKELLDGLDDDRAAAIAAAAHDYAARRPGSADALFAAAAPDELSTRDPELAPEANTILGAAGQADRSLQVLASPPNISVESGVGGAQGIGDDIEAWFRGRRAAALRLLEQLSYYEMKERAGRVGASLGRALGGLQPPRPLNVHLVGHSFGARVVTSAADAFPGAPSVTLASLSLLQGAFSHNAMSVRRDGAFRGVVGKVAGAVSITHTHNDKACTLIYALASRLSRDARLAVGDRNDQYGSMGGNGAQFEPDEPDGRAAKEWTVSSGFKPERGRINNFLAKDFIKDRGPQRDAHGDVCNPVVGELVARTMEA